MSLIQHNIEKEERLIELLGYSLVGPSASNTWLILDENQNQVGFIKYKKLYNGNKKKGYTKIFGYHTLLDSNNIYWDYTRSINDINGNILDIDGYYEFDIKRDNQENDYVHINISAFLPSISIKSMEYGYMNFKVDYKNELYLNYKSKTDKFNFEEVLIYRNIENDSYYDNKYIYQIRCCKRDRELYCDSSKGVVTREISGIQDRYCDNKLKIEENTWVFGHLRTHKENDYYGTVHEMAVKHQYGIDSFSHFRYLINQIIPFKEEVLSTILSDEIMKNLSIFFPEYEEELVEEAPQKKLTNSNN